MEECFVVFVGDPNRLTAAEYLTKNKVYKANYDIVEAVLSSTGFYYTIENDIKEKRDYYYTYFITLDSWREKQLNKIID